MSEEILSLNTQDLEGILSLLDLNGICIWHIGL